MNRVIAAMGVRFARAALFLDIGDFAARRQLTIATDDAPTCERPEPEKPHQTHCRSSVRLMREANDVPASSQVGVRFCA